MEMSVTNLRQPESVTAKTHERLEISDVPLDAFLAPWERVDWVEVGETIANGGAARIDLADGRNECDWINCARVQLGCRNITTFFGCVNGLYQFWVVGREKLGNVLLGGNGLLMAD